MGVPRGSMVKNLSAHAGDTGWIPDPGRPHVPWSNKDRAPQLPSLSSRAQDATTEPACSGARAPQREATRERSLQPQLERRPCSQQLEEACAAAKGQHSQN